MQKAVLGVLVLAAFVAVSVIAGEIPSREIKLKGDLLIMPLVDRHDTVQKPIPGLIKIYVEEKFAGEIEGRLEPLPASYGFRPHGDVPAVIEIFKHNKQLARLISRKPIPDLAALSSDAEMNVRFDVYSGKETLMHKISGKMKKAAFKDRREATRESHKKDTSAVSILVNAKHPVDLEPVKIVLCLMLVLLDFGCIQQVRKTK